MDNIIRVLHVFGSLNRGGAETMIMNIYRNIDRSKVQFDFIVHTREKCDYDNEIKSLGGKVYSIPRYRGKNHFEYKKSWHEFIKLHPEYKIIHGHVRSTASIYLNIAKKLGLITIAHSHNTSSGKGGKAVIKDILQYPIRYIADYLFACSEYSGKWLFGEKACQKNNFYLINNSVDVEKFAFKEEVKKEKRKQLDVEGKFVIGHIGRFHTQKNHDFIIEIFKSVYDKNNNAILMLIGDGDLKPEIERKVANLGLMENVIFTGTRPDIPELLQAMDVFVFPSLFEGLGMVLIEAQTSGLSCIVADTIPQEAFITDLIKSIPLRKSAEYWADIILQQKTLETRRNMTNLVRAAGYDIAENAKKMEEFYCERVR